MEIEITSSKQYEALLELADVLFVVMGHVESTGKAGINAVESVTKKIRERLSKNTQSEKIRGNFYL